jgi:hypothetical protein
MVVAAAQDHGTAKRLRNSVPIQTYSVTMTTVKCEQCGEKFAIAHRTELQDAPLATRQAAWLSEKFVWDHIQETKHTGSIRLPFLADGKSAAH